MPKRWCIGCRKLFDLDSTGTQRCPPCQATATTARNARANTTARGLGWTHVKRKQQDENYQAADTCQCPGCPRCGTGCGEPFTMDNPKTAGHVVPRSQGGGDGPILAICRSCNSSDGGRLAHQGSR
jgi:5-methylcytosine-specific restriction endonuclease McrA